MTYITQLPLCWNSFQKSPKHLSVPSSLFPMDPKLSQSICTLKWATLRVGRTPDMIETPLRSMINKVLWKAMLTPVLSTMLVHHWGIKHCFIFPLYSIHVCPRSDLSILLYYCSISLPTNTFNSFPWHYISPWPSHMLASLMDVTVTEWAQSIYPSRGHTNPDLDTCAST